MAACTANKDPPCTFTYQKERDSFLKDLKQFHKTRG